MAKKPVIQDSHQNPVNKVSPQGSNNIGEELFNSWEAFKATFGQRLFPNEPFRRGKYLFRGHSDPHWTLSTTFDRMFSNQPKATRLQIAEELLEVFKRSLEGEEIPAEVRGNDSLFLALGQHYGLPTRLLDWTESPYIAAFFAYNSRALWGVTDQSIAIWVLDTTHPIWSSHYGVEIIEVPSFGNKRIRNQSGKFTLSRTPFPDLESYVAAHGDEGKPLRKFLLPAPDYSKALADLDAMGIHHGTVYPEIEGAAQMALFRIVSRFNTFVQFRTSRPA
ncbi:MAG TPA: FRG domain-containing protein [Blastocatellia bacterium]|nr:FRG domain-containing protein [Blastocatellia bacterium]